MTLKLALLIVTLALGLLAAPLAGEAQDQIEGEGRVILVDLAAGTVALATHWSGGNCP